MIDATTGSAVTGGLPSIKMAGFLLNMDPSFDGFFPLQGAYHTLVDAFGFGYLADETMQARLEEERRKLKEEQAQRSPEPKGRIPRWFLTILTHKYK